MMRRATFVLAPGLIAIILIAGFVGTAHAMPPGAHPLSKPAIPDASGRCSSWSVVPSQSVTGDNSLLEGISALSDHDVWAVGYVIPPSHEEQALIEHYDGAAWSIVPNPQPAPFISELYDVAAISADDVWAVGYSAASGGYNQPLTIHWDGISWKVVSSPPFAYGGGLGGVAVVSPTDIWAVGYASLVQNVEVTLIEHWNGMSWSVVDSPNPQGSWPNPDLAAITAISASDIWAVGSFEDDSSSFQTLTEHWDGTAWSIVSSPNVGGASTANNFTDVAAHSSTDVWAVGLYVSDLANGYDQSLIEHWDGTSWAVVPSPNPGISTWLSSISAVPGGLSLWVVGWYYDTMKQAYYALTARWDGRQWSTIPAAIASGELGGQLNGVSALAASDVWTVGISSVPASAFPRSGKVSDLPSGHRFGAANIQVTLTERYAQLGPPTGNCPL